jgi:hypothetical protein
MSGPNRRFLTGFCFCGAFTSLVIWCLILTLRGTHRWPSSVPDEPVESEWQRSQDLEALRQAILNRVDTRLRLTVEVVEGRLGLLEAAGRFRDLDKEWPALEPRRALRGATDEERYCRVVIATVESFLYDRPQMRTAVIERLEAELRGYLGRGDLRLPGKSPQDCGPGASAPKKGGQ